MKQIHKQPEPQAFIDWKLANKATIDKLIAEGHSGNDIWDLLPSNPSKDEVENDYYKALLRTALITEQLYLCCYCHDAIQNEGSYAPIEHFLPKETYKDGTFKYTNLFVSCNGGQKEPAKPRILHCDTFKGQEDPSLNNIPSPLEAIVETLFIFKENGTISSKTAQGQEAIKFFNLDCARLNLRRKIAIEAYIYNEELSIEELISEVLQVVDEKMIAFCLAIVQVLEHYK